MPKPSLVNVTFSTHHLVTLETLYNATVNEPHRNEMFIMPDWSKGDWFQINPSNIGRRKIGRFIQQFTRYGLVEIDHYVFRILPAGRDYLIEKGYLPKDTPQIVIPEPDWNKINELMTAFGMIPDGQQASSAAPVERQVEHLGFNLTIVDHGGWGEVKVS